ncbi:hypothetical protein AB0P17_36370 [Streptomyces sp. NPDC088124]|uniref:hypothetical protein n=1 Tax=Streptomyces sp. NPDC088124 TaxID=3154654 RepID=UPI0034277734
MAGICRTPDEAFQAGWDALCEHHTSPVDCPHCRLTDAEIGRLVALLRPSAAPLLRVDADAA